MLVKRFQNGEPGVFDELVDRYRKYVYELAFRFTYNREDAWDICQEVFVKVFKSLGNLKDGAALHTWLRTITVNTSIDHLRQRSKRPVLDDLYNSGPIPDTNTESPDHPTEIRELRDVISEAVAQLPRRQKTVFILRHYENLSLKEIARTLKCPLGTVKANLFHATRRLRKLLQPYVS